MNNEERIRGMMKKKMEQREEQLQRDSIYQKIQQLKNKKSQKKLDKYQPKGNSSLSKGSKLSLREDSNKHIFEKVDDDDDEGKEGIEERNQNLPSDDVFGNEDGDDEIEDEDEDDGEDNEERDWYKVFVLNKPPPVPDTVPDEFFDEKYKKQYMSTRIQSEIDTLLPSNFFDDVSTRSKILHEFKKTDSTGKNSNSSIKEIYAPGGKRIKGTVIAQSSAKEQIKEIKKDKKEGKNVEKEEAEKIDESVLESLKELKDMLHKEEIEHVEEQINKRAEYQELAEQINQYDVLDIIKKKVNDKKRKRGELKQNIKQISHKKPIVEQDTSGSDSSTDYLQLTWKSKKKKKKMKK